MSLISIITNEDDTRYYPNFELIEIGNVFHLRVAVPGLTSEEIRVQTIGTQLFIQTAHERKLRESAKRMSGSHLSPQFDMELVIDNSVTVGSPHIDHGVLVIPMTTNPEIKMEVRDYSVRESSKIDAASDTDDWIFSGAF